MSTIFDHFCQLMLSSARNSSSCTMNQLLLDSRIKKSMTRWSRCPQSMVSVLVVVLKPNFLQLLDLASRTLYHVLTALLETQFTLLRADRFWRKKMQ